VLSMREIGYEQQEVIDEGGDDGTRCRRDAAVPGEVGGIALASEVSELEQRHWTLCGLSTHWRRRPSRRHPANQEIRIARRITQSAAESNGPT